MSAYRDRQRARHRDLDDPTTERVVEACPNCGQPVATTAAGSPFCRPGCTPPADLVVI